jgi:hypothetical protein
MAINLFMVNACSLELFLAGKRALQKTPNPAKTYQKTRLQQKWDALKSVKYKFRSRINHKTAQTALDDAPPLLIITHINQRLR